jgi:hypothetical protein
MKSAAIAGSAVFNCSFQRRGAETPGNCNAFVTAGRDSGQRLGFNSARNAITGSIFAASRAGTRHAINVAKTRMTTTPPKTSGS